MTADHDEYVWTTGDGDEVAVRKGVVLREGQVVLAAHDKDGVGCSAYLTPSEAREVAAGLIEAAHG